MLLLFRVFLIQNGPYVVTTVTAWPIRLYCRCLSLFDLKCKVFKRPPCCI
uniref:Uncharacterized protein n=1 Tax=Anguilla anguilla TaxID=7936 RepID=A0A0E9QT94_ANGAN